MSVAYFKRFRMEVDLRRHPFDHVPLPRGYRLVAWSSERLVDHADAKYNSFRGEVDSQVFPCLGDLVGCHKLMEEICQKDGFRPEATWLAEYVGVDADLPEFCGTIQGIRANDRYGGIQNVGVTPEHRGHGLGTALIAAAMVAFQQMGLPRAYLEVTAQNERAIALYRRLGFRRTKTLYKAVELAYS